MQFSALTFGEQPLVITITVVDGGIRVDGAPDLISTIGILEAAKASIVSNAVGGVRKEEPSRIVPAGIAVPGIRPN